MPRKKKIDTAENTIEEVKKPSKNTVSKEVKATTKKRSSSTGKTSTRKSSTKSKDSTRPKKKEVAKKSTSKKVEKETSSKKSTTRTRKSTNSTSTKKTTKVVDLVEYYDLPYRYNQTIIKLLYQTPDMLFIYWDISDEDRLNFIKEYGDNFFDNTKPVLIIHNITMNYSFEVEINDFANSWYLHINDTNCEYSVELGRRPKYFNDTKQIDIKDDYLFVTYSNQIESPNDHILFDKNLTNVYFKDVKTNITTSQDITSLSFMRNIGKIYDLSNLNIDFTEDSLNSYMYLNLKNPSSGNPTSTFK